MGSIVQELQMDAMSSTSNISDLLRKSMVVARKLKITEFEQWVIQELNGFKVPQKDIPEYREVVGKIQWFNVYSGWCPVIIEDEEILDIVSKSKIAQPITEIEDLVKNTSDYLVILIPQSQQNLLSKLFNETTQFQLYFGKSQAQRMIDTVRNIILEWALKLEEDGIMGEGLSFSREEKQTASQHDYTVNNFYGNASGIQIQQHTSQSTQTMLNEIDLDKVSSFISTLKENLNQIGLQAESQKVVESELINISTQLESTQPKSSVIQQSLKTIRNVFEGVTGSLIASGILYQLSQIGM
ncbi:hypothetical protein V7103_24010 [Neobacillus drentensis]|uniref:AbiTii domain-containing protein n=1 Tax=Neobacillus drentensis TaxID=220684 RepID=UPI002FFD7755